MFTIMKATFIFTIVLVLLTLGCNKPARQGEEPATKQLIVKFKDTANQSAIDSLTAEVGLQKVKEIPELNIQVYKIAPDMTLEEAIQKCQQNPHVQYAEPDYQVRALEDNKVQK